MPLSKEDLKNIFSTPVLSRQICKFIAAKGAAGTGRDAIHDVFASIHGARVVKTTIAELLKQGRITRTEGVYMATTGFVVPGENADRAWKAARILRTFSPSELAKIADIDVEHSAQICRVWRRSGLLVVMGRNGQSPIYRLMSDQTVRPIIHQERKP